MSINKECWEISWQFIEPLNIVDNPPLLWSLRQTADSTFHDYTLILVHCIALPSCVRIDFKLRKKLWIRLQWCLKIDNLVRVTIVCIFIFFYNISGWLFYSRMFFGPENQPLCILVCSKDPQIIVFLFGMFCGSQIMLVCICTYCKKSLCLSQKLLHSACYILFANNETSMKRWIWWNTNTVQTVLIEFCEKVFLCVLHSVSPNRVIFG